MERGKKQIGIGSFVVVPSGRVGRWTSTTEGMALVMSGNDKFVVPAGALVPAFDL